MASDGPVPEPFASPESEERLSPGRASSPLTHPREPLSMLVLGILLFCGLLVFSWMRISEVEARNVEWVSSLQAKMGTYSVRLQQYERLLGKRPDLSWVAKMEQRSALAVAEQWARLSRESSDPAYRGKAALNAAALYGTAGRYARATDALKLATIRDPERGAVYRAFLPLYAPKPSPVRIAPDMAALLRDISGGPLITVRNAGLAGKKKEAISALAPGARVGTRLAVASSVVGILLFSFFITAIIIWIRTLTGKHFKLPASPPVSWGIGAALMIISLTYIVSDLLFGLLIALLPALKSNSGSMLPLQVVANLCGFLIAVPFLLAATGHSPWRWSILGWRFSWRNAGIGVLGLIAATPLVFAASWISAMLLGGRGSGHPMIPELMQTQSPWVAIMLAVMAIVMAPLMEETLFRGLLFRALDARLSFWPAACISGFLFALVHGEVVVLAPITVLGITLAYLTKRTNSLLAPAVAHAIQNGGATAMILLVAWAARSFRG